jgi:hypothetical protein
MGPELTSCQTNLQRHRTTFDAFSKAISADESMCSRYVLSDLCKRDDGFSV